jgi:hypothetical protein
VFADCPDFFKKRVSYCNPFQRPQVVRKSLAGPARTDVHTLENFFDAHLYYQVLNMSMMISLEFSNAQQQASFVIRLLITGNAMGPLQSRLAEGGRGNPGLLNDLLNNFF